MPTVLTVMKFYPFNGVKETLKQLKNSINNSKT